MQSSTPSVSSVLLVGVWLGLLGGIIESVIYAIRMYGVGEFMVMNWHFPWMVPVFSAAILLLAATAALPFARWQWVPLGRQLTIIALGFIAFFGAVSAVTGLSRTAAIILSLGLAIQVGRAVQWDMSQLGRIAGRTIGVVGGSVALVMAGMLGASWLGERNAIARLTPNSNSPNVILIVLDTVRAKSLSTYGYGRVTMPTLDQLAREGVAFDHAVSTAPWTLPAHASLFTGTYPHEHRADWSKPLDGRYPTLAEALRDRGYVTGAFSANTLNVTRTHGLARGFIHFEDLPLSLGRFALSSSIGRIIVGQGSLRHWLQYHEVADRQPAGEITGNCLSWLRAQHGRPFFAFLNYFDAHDPYLPPEPFATKFGPRRSPTARFWHTGVAAWPVDRQKLPAKAQQAEVDAYDGAIAYVDSQIDRLVRFLEAEGIRQNTLLIVTSDHGEQLGEHGLYNHGNSMYRPVVHIPLVMNFPGRVGPGIRVARPVSLRDIPRTVLDLIGQAGTNPFPGDSLARVLAGTPEDALARPVLIEATKRPFGNETWYPLLKGHMQSVVADGFQYIRNGDGSEEMYDFENDREETMNLINSPDHAAALAGLRRAVDDRASSVGSSP